MRLQKRIQKLIQKDLYRCRRLHGKLSTRLKKLPAGSVSLRKGELCRFLRIDGKQYLVPIRGDEQLLRALITKRIIKKGLPILSKRIKLCETYLSNEIIYDPEEIVKGLSVQYHNLSGIDVFLDGDINMADWRISDYERNSMGYAGEHFTADGVRCRSKSEAMIGTRLEQRGIMYHTEPKIKLHNRTVCPDFEMIIQETRELKYWEHFGMIDNLQYAQKCIVKLKDYSENGFFLGENMFITYETQSKPLTMLEIDRTIDRILGLA